MRFQTASRTDVGRVRKRNEDSLGFFKPTESAILKRYGICLAVADGVGGEAHGDVASRTAIATLLKEYYQRPADIAVQQRLKNGVAKANTAVLQASEELRSYGTATTLVAAVILADRAVIANVGDSRAYVISRPKAIARQISLDHSLVQEQVRMGILTPEEAEQAPNKNVITRALGTDPAVKVDIFEVPLVAGDTVLLCSDGLVRVVTDTEIADIVASNPISTAVDKLVALANSRGGPDNISVCAARAVSGIVTAALPVAVVASVVILIGVASVLGTGQLGKVFDLLGWSNQGNLIVTSTPPGAAISLDGKDTEQTTPWTFTVKPGNHTVLLTLAGYDRYTELLELPAWAKKTVSVDLARSHITLATTVLTITSIPSGAQVYVDDWPIGVTPITNRSTTVGNRTLRLALQGYEDYVEPLDLKASDEIRTVDVLLTKTPVALATATLTITSSPSGAKVILDGATIGTTPIANRTVTPGSHALILSLAGYQDYPESIVLDAGASRTVSVSLTKMPVIPTTATLTVTSTPSGALATLDGYEIGKTPITNRSTGAGKQRVLVLKLDGYADYQGSIDLTAGQLTTVPVSLTKTPATPSTATLTITSTPSGAQVFLDGTSMGTTPIANKAVFPGSHTLRLTLTGYEDYTETLNLQEGETKSVTVQLTVAATATLSVVCEHGNARVVLNGEDTVETTPHPFIRKPDAYTVCPELANHRDYATTVDSRAGDLKPVVCAAEPWSEWRPRWHMEVPTSPACRLSAYSRVRGS